jgi:outer membrane lipoprotein-sorting protein
MFLVFLFSSSLWAQFLPDSFKAKYEERYVSTTQKKEKKSHGTIHYKYPRHIRFEVLSPDPALFISNAEKSWYYTPPFIEGEQGQVVLQESNKLVLIKLLDVLRQGLKSNSVYKIQMQKQVATLTFLPTYQKEFQLNKVVLRATKNMSDVKTLSELKELDLHQASGQKVTLGFSDFESGVTFAPDHFVFNIPKNTKVMNEAP